MKKPGAYFKWEGENAPCWVITTSEYSFPVTEDEMTAVLRDVMAWTYGTTTRNDEQLNALAAASIDFLRDARERLGDFAVPYNSYVTLRVLAEAALGAQRPNPQDSGAA